MAFNQCYINLSLKKKRMPLGILLGHLEHVILTIKN